MLTTRNSHTLLCVNYVNLGVHLSAIIEDIRSSYPELVVESVGKSFVRVT